HAARNFFARGRFVPILCCLRAPASAAACSPTPSATDSSGSPALTSLMAVVGGGPHDGPRVLGEASRVASRSAWIRFLGSSRRRGWSSPVRRALDRQEVTTDPIGPYMIAASPRACAAGLSGTTSAPVATCPAREDALDAQPVRTMTAEDEGPALETMVLAFAADPVTRWAWPHTHQYMAAMPRFVRAFGGGAFAHGAAYCTNEYTGVALWLPPGVHPDRDRLGVPPATPAP